jgi:hypothetical protein
VEAQPAQVRQDRRLGAKAIAGLVEVIDAQQPLPPLEPSHQPAQQGRAEVAMVQGARGGGGKAATMAPIAPCDPRRDQLADVGRQQDDGISQGRGPKWA